MVTTLNDTVINSANTTVDTPFTLTTVNFGVTTNPNPLQANTNGTITVVASKFGTDSVTCSQIKLVVSVGSSAASLTNDAATINSIPPKSWALDAASEGGTFIFKPVAGGYVDLGDEGLAFTLDKIAISDIGVTEFFVEGSFQIGGNPKPEMITVPLPKFPQGFTLSALTADQSSINPGEPVTLSWSGSQGDYTLSYGGQNILISPIRVTTLLTI